MLRSTNGYPEHLCPDDVHRQILLKPAMPITAIVRLLLIRQPQLRNVVVMLIKEEELPTCRE